MKAPYCLVCKKLTNNNNSEVVKINGKMMIKSNCPICRNKKSIFVSQGGGLLDSLGLNTPQNRMKNVLWNAVR